MHWRGRAQGSGEMRRCRSVDAQNMPIREGKAIREEMRRRRECGWRREASNEGEQYGEEELKARIRRMMRPTERARAHGMRARGRRPRVWRFWGRRRTRVARSAVGRLTRARSARAGERRRQGKVGKSWPVGWSHARKKRVRRQESRSARAWLARSKASEEAGPV